MKALEDVLSHRPVPDAIDERLDNAEIDVGFKEGQANLAQRHFDALRRQARLSPKGAENVLEACAQRWNMGSLPDSVPTRAKFI